MNHTVTHDRHSTGPAPVPHVPAASGVVALARGVLVVRWALLAWMLVLAGIGIVEGRELVAAVGAVAVVAAWVCWLTVARPRWTQTVLLVDLAVAVGLVVAGTRFGWLATIYPVTSALTWGATRGVSGGLVAGGVLGVASLVAGGLTSAVAGAQLLQVLRDPVYFLLAGGGIGFVARLLEDSAAQVRVAQAAQVRATERAARLTERESLGRQIHDSVLQTLALVHKRGRELATKPQVTGTEVDRLADLAAAQERVLRALIFRPPEDPATAEGSDAATTASLRDRLEQAVTTVEPGLPVAVSATNDIRLPGRHVDEIGAAVEQALHNVVRHAHADQAWVFAEVDGGDVVVNVRDDGTGFVFDEVALRSANKYGLLASIRGRVVDLGGRLRIETAPGRGTELELRVPVASAQEDNPS